MTEEVARQNCYYVTFQNKRYKLLFTGEELKNLYQENRDIRIAALGMQLFGYEWSALLEDALLTSATELVTGKSADRAKYKSAKGARTKVVLPEEEWKQLLQMYPLIIHHKMAITAAAQKIVGGLHTSAEVKKLARYYKSYLSQIHYEIQIQYEKADKSYRKAEDILPKESLSRIYLSSSESTVLDNEGKKRLSILRQAWDEVNKKLDESCDE
jgi:hypothetical protein